jgi:hypothetical protein
MVEAAGAWLGNLEGHPSCMACAVRPPGKKALVRVWNADIEDAAMDNATRSVLDVFQILKLHRLPSQYLQWNFSGGIMHALCRSDEWALLVVSQKEPPLPEDYLQELAAGFMHLGD